jgi:hypothetical protein
MSPASCDPGATGTLNQQSEAITKPAMDLWIISPQS